MNGCYAAFWYCCLFEKGLCTAFSVVSLSWPMKDSQDIVALVRVEVADGDEVSEILVLYQPCNRSLRQTMI